MLLTSFNAYIGKEALFTPADNLLVGVSGGIDSVVLVDLLNQAGYSYAIAHCNFHLRGKESDEDADFVYQLAVSCNKEFFIKDFDTRRYAKDNGISVEMAARELRYEWFEELRIKHHFKKIVVAHHRDDQVETFFLKLARGTGIRGLTGMKPIYGHIIRPLLFASRNEIEEYQISKMLIFREDSSNKQISFHRNRVRHQIIPSFEKINPSFRENLIQTITYLDDVSFIYHREITAAWNKVSVIKGDEIHLSIEGIRSLIPVSAYLFEFLYPFHFNAETAADILKALDGKPGKQFFSKTHRIVIDRSYLILQEHINDDEISRKKGEFHSSVKNITFSDERRYYLEENFEIMEEPIRLKISTLLKDNLFKIDPSPAIAFIDKAKLKFPLLIRKWQKGDFFFPLGMKGEKKLSDFFVDQKMSLTDKESCWVLTNGEQIVWIMGQRLDNRYKVTPATSTVLKIEVI